MYVDPYDLYLLQVHLLQTRPSLSPRESLMNSFHPENIISKPWAPLPLPLHT